MTQKKEPFYLTTAIAYTSGRPHIGNTYEIILSDAIARFKRAQGYDVFFQTGTDEHGVKIEEKAKAAGVSPQEFVDDVAAQIKSNWDLMNTSYDYFVRTTDDYHVKEVQSIFKRLYDQGDIYKGTYEGWYCTPCESFWTESQLVDGCCPDCGRPVKKAKEEAYFFNMQKYADRLIKYIEDHPDFIQPESRKNEMLNNFLRPGLQDLCVSRTSFTWGVPVDFDPKHVVYVWIDALSNYITTLGYHANGKSDEKFNKYWPATHIIGKDILRFHTIYWPIILMALDLPLPKKVFGHPWLLTGSDKMSKSKGNVIYAEDLVAHFGVDAVRYYCLHEMPFAQDGTITWELMIERINSDLANILGNLVSRTIAMSNKYFGGLVTNPNVCEPVDEELKACALETKKKVEAKMDELRVGDALDEVFTLLRRTNKYIDETAPWVLAKEDGDKEQLAAVMAHLAASLRVVAHLIQPFMMTTSNAIMEQLGLSGAFDLENLELSGFPENVTVVSKGTPIFPRLDMDEEIAYIQSQMNSGKPQEKEWNPEEVELKSEKDQIKFDDFDKVEIRVAEVKEVEKVEGSDKLLRFRLDAGDGEDRQILSGIAKFYPNEQELVGKKLQIVANLKPRKMMKKYVSQGMILSAEHDGKLTVLTVDPSVPNGSVIG